MRKEEDPIVTLWDFLVKLQEEFDSWKKNELTDKEFSSIMANYLSDMFEIIEPHIKFRKVEKEKKD